MKTDKKLRFLLCIFGLLTLISVKDANCETMQLKLMENIGSGVKYASQLFGINTASDIANLVSKAFAPSTQPQKTSTSSSSGNFEATSNDPTQLFYRVLQLFGMDTTKIKAMTLNGMIFIAQMVGHFLTPFKSDGLHSVDVPETSSYSDFPNTTRSVREGTPFGWTITDHQRKLPSLMAGAQDNKLLEYLVEPISAMQQSTTDGECIKLLLCKTAPFVWRMQDAVMKSIQGQADEDRQQMDGSPFNILSVWKEYKQHSKFCQRRYSHCNVTSIQGD